jgi:predicted MFS family arabinose efflux permease
VPTGSIPFILACAMLQGGGFGVAWPYAVRTIVANAAPDEQSLAASAAPTLQRIGYAVGAALAGIIANASGFGDGLTTQSARSVAIRLFVAFIPLALLGLAAGIRLAAATTSKRQQVAAADDVA